MVENIARDQKSVGHVLPALPQQPVKEGLVLEPPRKRMQLLSYVPVRSVDNAHEVPFHLVFRWTYEARQSSFWMDEQETSETGVAPQRGRKAALHRCAIVLGRDNKSI